MVRVQPHLLLLVSGQRPRLLPRSAGAPRPVRGRGRAPRAGARRRRRRRAGSAAPLPRPAPPRRRSGRSDTARSRSAKLPMAASARSSASPASITGGRRLARERLLPHRRMRVEREDPLGIADQAVRHFGIERMPGALADEPHDALVAAEHALEGGITGEVHDPHRQRDLLALRVGRAARARPSARAGGRVGPAPPVTAPARRRAYPPPRTPPPGAYAARAPFAEAGGRPAARAPARAVSGSGSARRSPVRTSRPDPYTSGCRWVVSEPPKTCGVTCASVVQPECESRQA